MSGGGVASALSWVAQLGAYDVTSVATLGCCNNKAHRGADAAVAVCMWWGSTGDRAATEIGRGAGLGSRHGQTSKSSFGV